MRVVQLAHKYGLNNIGGAAIAATRIHRALLAAGIDSHYVCVDKMENGENVHEVLPHGSAVRRIHGALRFCEHVAGKMLCPPGFANGLDLVPLFGLEKLLARINPDIVQVHRTNGEVAPFQQLADLPYRFIFHLHDLYPFNALQAYPGDDRRYIDGFNTSNSLACERRAIRIKRKAMAKMKPTFVGPSQWICRCCQASIVARGLSTVTIPYLFDRRFVYNSEMRQEHDKFTLLFGCFRGRRNRIKGWDDVCTAVRLLPAARQRRVEIRVFGETGADEMIGETKVHVLGDFSNPDQLVHVYNSADAFLLASKEDNSPLTKFEALYCGLPVLAFDRTGCAEFIEHRVSGWIAKDGDCLGYAEGIAHWQDKFEHSEVPYERISSDVRARFAPSGIVAQMESLYKEVLSK